MPELAPSGRVRILATGFGPFPGVARNATAHLMQSLAASSLPGIDLRTAVLPVCWSETAGLCRTLMAAHSPHAVLHFGVSRQARGFVIETRAYNFCGARPDAAGRTAVSQKTRPRMPAALDATLPCAALVSALRRAGLPARLSRDPGRYLCNAALFETLAAAAHNVPSPLVGFVHVPAFGVGGAATPLILERDLIPGAQILLREAARAVLRQPRNRTRRGERCGGAKS